MTEPARTWTVEEANAALPEVRDRLADLREAVEEQSRAAEQVRDLRRAHGEDLEDEDHPRHDAFREQADRAAEAKDRVEAIRRRLSEAGVRVQDTRLGHVDFPARRGDQPVALCWREGEDEVRAWHRRGQGIADRRPLDGN